MFDTMSLCVSCKACKRECPTGVDMAKMKIEFLHHYHANHGLPFKEKLIAWLPRYAPIARKLGFLLNLRNTIPGLPTLSEKLLGFTRHRPLPAWRRDSFGHHSELATRTINRKLAEAQANREGKPAEQQVTNREVVLLIDTFNTYFEPENARAALSVLEAAGYRVHIPEPVDKGRPLCCGRTFLNAGLVDQAREEMLRTVETLKPFVKKGVPIVGLEPSCLLSLRDEFLSLLPGEDTDHLSLSAMLIEEFLAREYRTGNLHLNLKPIAQKKALLHGHCHQKAFGVMADVTTLLKLVPELDVAMIDSGCCGMAGAFGYDASHYNTSMAMAELAVLPRVREADADALIVAGGTSCRGQIENGTQRDVLHPVQILALALDA